MINYSIETRSLDIQGGGEVSDLDQQPNSKMISNWIPMTSATSHDTQGHNVDNGDVSGAGPAATSFSFKNADNIITIDSADAAHSETVRIF